MSFVEELAKLQQLKLDGALTEEEFAQAKQKLLETDTSIPAPSTPSTIKLSLKEGLDEIVDEESTLGGAANQYVKYKFSSMIVGAILFIIMAIIMVILFTNASNNMHQGFNSFPGGGFGH